MLGHAEKPERLSRAHDTPVLLIVQSFVALILCIACANLADLQLAHTTARRRKMSLRAAPGGRGWSASLIEARELGDEGALQVQPGQRRFAQ